MKPILERAKEVFDVEIEGLKTVKESLDSNFEKMVEMSREALNSGTIQNRSTKDDDW